MFDISVGPNKRLDNHVWYCMSKKSCPFVYRECTMNILWIRRSHPIILDHFRMFIISVHTIKARLKAWNISIKSKMQEINIHPCVSLYYGGTWYQIDGYRICGLSASRIQYIQLDIRPVWLCNLISCQIKDIHPNIRPDKEYQTKYPFRWETEFNILSYTEYQAKC